jgi:hypothetical protein
MQKKSENNKYLDKEYVMFYLSVVDGGIIFDFKSLDISV